MALLFDGLDPEEKTGQQTAYCDEIRNIDECVGQCLQLLGSHVAEETDNPLAQFETVLGTSPEQGQKDDREQDLHSDDAENGLGGLASLEADGAQSERKDGSAPAQPTHQIGAAGGYAEQAVGILEGIAQEAFKRVDTVAYLSHYGLAIYRNNPGKEKVAYGEQSEYCKREDDAEHYGHGEEFLEG